MARDPVKRSASSKVYRASRKAKAIENGTCVCGGERAPGKLRCRKCLDCTKARKIDKISKGICPYCGGPCPGYASCEECRLRKAGRLRGYKLTIEERSLLEAQQGGACAICKFVPITNKATDRLHVDHCHDSGKVRGLLCTNCNNGLGRFKTSCGLLKAAWEYVQRAS